jgi:hypothetical protein
MSAFFGVQHERVAMGTPYKVHYGYLSTPAAAFSEEWQTSPRFFVETISASARLDLTHHGVRVATIAEYYEQAFLDSIPEDVSHWLSHYKIDQDSSLSLDITMVLNREFWLLSDETSNARLVVAGATATSANRSTKSVFWVEPGNIDQAKNWALAMRNQRHGTNETTHHAGPGFCISTPSELLSIVVWGSADRLPYNRGQCQNMVRDAMNKISAWDSYVEPTTEGFIRHLREKKDTIMPHTESPLTSKATDSSPLMDITDATELQCFVLAEIVRRDMGPTISMDALHLVFKGCLLPFSSFTKALLEETPEDLLRDLRLWMYLRFVGHHKTSSADLTPNDARALAEAISQPDWKENLHDPLSLGYLPY